MVLHCADISHPAKDWNLHYRWTSQLLEEFFLQGDMEKKLGLPFSPLCDRNNTLIAESQIGQYFINFYSPFIYNFDVNNKQITMVYF